MMTPPVALITGSAKRIGRGIAETLHRRGFNVVLHYQLSETAAEELADSFNATRSNSACIIKADLRDDKAVRELANQARHMWGSVSLLVNNASRFEPDLTDLPDPEIWQQTMAINVQAPHLLASSLAPELRQNRGNIINLIDIYAERPLEGHSLYSSSKAALDMLTKSLAIQLAPDVRVNGIAPGAILWPENGMDSESQKRLLKKIPLARLGSVEAICRTLEYLIDCDYITGQVIRVDGGRSITI